MNNPGSEDIFDNFFYLLGVFVHKFATIENNLGYLCRELSGVPKANYAALVGPSRARDSIERIKRLFESAGTPVDPDILDMTKQLNAINTARSELLHFSTFYMPENKIITLNPFKITPIENQFSKENLIQMTKDLNQAELIMMRFSAQHDKNGPDVPFVESIDHAIGHAPHTWLYKPAQPNNQKSKFRKNPK